MKPFQLQMVGVGSEYPPPQYYGTPPCYQHSPQRIPYVGQYHIKQYFDMWKEIRYKLITTCVPTFYIIIRSQDFTLRSLQYRTDPPRLPTR